MIGLKMFKILMKGAEDSQMPHFFCSSFVELSASSRKDYWLILIGNESWSLLITVGDFYVFLFEANVMFSTDWLAQVLSEFMDPKWVPEALGGTHRIGNSSESQKRGISKVNGEFMKMQ